MLRVSCLHAVPSCRTSAGAAGVALPPRGRHRPVLHDRRRRSAIGLGRQSPRLMPGGQLLRASHASRSNLQIDMINRIICALSQGYCQKHNSYRRLPDLVRNLRVLQVGEDSPNRGDSHR